MCNALQRCVWCGDDPLYQAYHDQEWGVPQHDDIRLFEKLVLEGAQAGLSWITILKKRDNYRRAFSEFDAEKVARYGDTDIRRLLDNPGIIRNRLKVNAAVNNAKAVLEIRERYGSLDHFLWRFVDGRSVQNHFRAHDEIPAQTELSQKLSKELKAHGFKFVGPTICYALMQSIGMVNDHVVDCFRYQQVAQMGMD